MGLDRRSLLIGAAASCLVAPAWAASTLRVASLDWSLTEVALDLGIVPVGAAELSGYRAWVGTPTVPAGVADLGLRTQPNLELLQQLEPDLILTLPERGDLAPSLARIAPTLSLPIYTAEHAPYARSAAVVSELGRRLALESAAHAAIERTDRTIGTCRQRLAHVVGRPVSVVRFVDAATIFVFGPGGLFDDVLQRLGLRNGWESPPSRWGFSRVATTALAKLPADTRLFYLEAPLPPDVGIMMRTDPFWRALPFVRSGSVGTLSAIWFFGALVAAERFALALTERLAGADSAR